MTNRWWAFSILLPVFLLIGLPALAETARVRTGEHRGYTRTVVQLAQPTGWRFGRVPGGYGMILDRPGVTFDISGAFRRIPRDRVEGLALDPTGPGLIIQTSCRCNARVFEEPGGFIVIDLRDGPPTAGSPFEAPLSGMPVSAEPPADSPASPVAEGPAAISADMQLPYFWGDLGSAQAGIGPLRARTPRPYDPVRDPDVLSARTDVADGAVGREGDPEAGSGGPDQTATQAFDITKDHSLPIPTKDSAPAVPDLGGQPAAEPSNQQGPDVAEGPAGHGGISGETGDVTAATTGSAAPHAQPVAVANGGAMAGEAIVGGAFDITAAHVPAADGPQAQSLPTLADSQVAADRAGMVPGGLLFAARPENPRLVTARDALLRQLSRAASQGLLDVPQADRPMMPSEEVAQRNNQPGPRQESAQGGLEEALSTVQQPDDHMTIKAETSIDRDSLHGLPQDEVTPDGETCVPDRVFDVAGWGDERPPAQQLAEKRQALIGEFDAPSAEQVGDLVRLYLYLGFGAEARATMAAFGVPVAHADLLLVMAESIDDGSARSPGRLVGMTGCDTAAALWAVLALPRLALGDPVNSGAVVRSFSALPIHLRRQIGPPLAERFLAIGKEDAARALRDATTRSVGDPGPETRLIGARLDLKREKIDQAEQVLESVVAENASASPEALILLIDTRIAAGVAVDTATVETAAALAFEHRGTELGSRLARAEVLAKAASGDFDAAFGTLDLQARSGEETRPTVLSKDLFTLLGAHADNATFLRHMLASGDLLAQAELPRALRQSLADRLVGLGFPEQSALVLAASAKPKPADRIILAKVALARNDPGAALRQVDGVDDPGAALIEAQALTQLGYHAQAATAFERAEVPQAVASSGWLAGNMSAMSQFGTPQQQAAVAAIAGAGEPATNDDPAAAQDAVPEQAPGSLAYNRQLLEQSQTTRTALTALLDAFPMPPSNP